MLAGNSIRFLERKKKKKVKSNFLDEVAAMVEHPMHSGNILHSGCLTKTLLVLCKKRRCLIKWDTKQNFDL